MTSTRALPAESTRSGRSRSGWLAITGLLLLSALPVLGGALRLGELAGGIPTASPPIPLIGHVVAMSVFCLVGAFQFSPALRVRRRWHRIAGRVLIPAGFVAALSSLGLVVFFGGPDDEFPLALVRATFAIAMTGSLAMGLSAIRRRDFVSHGAWLTRAYAIAVSGGTQALVFALWTIFIGEVDTFGETLLVAAAFVINSVAAELIIVRRAHAPRALV